MKKTWIDEFDKIFKIVQIADPIGLIEGGAPDDEYEVEALEIFFKRKKLYLNNDNVFDQIKEVFIGSFKEPVDDAKIHSIAVEVMDS